MWEHEVSVYKVDGVEATVNRASKETYMRIDDIPGTNESINFIFQNTDRKFVESVVQDAAAWIARLRDLCK